MAVRENVNRMDMPWDMKTIARALQTTIRVWRKVCDATPKDECHDEKCPFSMLCLELPAEMDEAAVTLQIMQGIRRMER